MLRHFNNAGPFVRVCRFALRHTLSLYKAGSATMIPDDSRRRNPFKVKITVHFSLISVKKINCKYWLYRYYKVLV